MRLRAVRVSATLLAVLSAALFAGAAPTGAVVVNDFVTLAQAAQGQGWAVHPDQTALGAERFVEGPLTPPAGRGSLEMTVATGADRALVFTVPKPGTGATPPGDVGAITATPWANLSGSFSTFTANTTAPASSIPTLKIVGYQVFNSMNPLLSTGFTTLNFEGVNQTPAPAANAWQTWTLGPSSMVWQSNTSEAFCLQATPCALSAFAAHYPNGAWGQIQVGLGTGAPAGATGNVDNVQISDGTTTFVYNFEAPGTVGYLLATAAGRTMGFGTAAGVNAQDTISASAHVVGIAATTDGDGWWTATNTGGVLKHGNATSFGDVSGLPLNFPMVGIAPTPTALGYWTVASDGGVFSFGNAGFHGSTGAMVLNQPVVGMASTLSGNGYWLVASDGGIFSYGDAAYHGSTGAMHLNQPVVGMAATASGNGYWLVARDGGIFAFGDAAFYGSTGAIHLNQPIVGMTATPTGNGYWFTASDGGVFSFGDAQFNGSGVPQLTGVVGIAGTGPPAP